MLLGIIIILWGILVLYFSLFKLKKEDYHKKDPVGQSAYIDGELLFRILSLFPWWTVKGTVILIGMLFIILGIFIIQ